MESRILHELRDKPCLCLAVFTKRENPLSFRVDMRVPIRRTQAHRDTHVIYDVIA